MLRAASFAPAHVLDARHEKLAGKEMLTLSPSLLTRQPMHASKRAVSEAVAMLVRMPARAAAASLLAEETADAIGTILTAESTNGVSLIEWMTSMPAGCDVGTTVLEFYLDSLRCRLLRNPCLSTRDVEAYVLAFHDRIWLYLRQHACARSVCAKTFSRYGDDD